MLREFKEATESHRIEKSDFDDFLFTSKELINNFDENLHKTLVLMEDVDLIFEEDEGFIAAAFQLASNTKVPIVLTLKKPCPHLCKIAPQQLIINFNPIPENKMIALLQSLAIIETGYKPSTECIKVRKKYNLIFK